MGGHVHVGIATPAADVFDRDVRTAAEGRKSCKYIREGDLTGSR